jgi:hypothetical protein
MPVRPFEQYSWRPWRSLTPGSGREKSRDGACKTGRFARSRHGRLHGGPDHDFSRPPLAFRHEALPTSDCAIVCAPANLRPIGRKHLLACAGLRALRSQLLSIPLFDLSHPCPSSPTIDRLFSNPPGVNMKPIPRTICLGLLALCAAAPAAEIPKTYRPPRLPDGHVDMQGIWKNSNLTPLERPKEFTQLAITAADAKRFKEQYLAPSGVKNLVDDPGRALEDRSIEPIRGELRSSQIIDPKDGRIPWNDAYREKPASLLRAVFNAFDNPEQRPGPERCLSSTGAPPMQPTIDGNIYQIVQTPATAVIVSEYIHDARVIRMSGTHSPPALTSWLGDSIGWWEKNTLVVETKYFAPNSAIRLRTRDNIFLVSPETTVIERFTRVSDKELNYVFTVSDPTYYTRPWTGETHLMSSTQRMFEFACHEGNYSMRDMLEAARANDPSTSAPAIAK